MITRKNKLSNFSNIISFFWKEWLNILIDENKLIPTRWNTQNRDWYTSLGYKFTKYNNILFVKQKELTHSSKTRVDVKCDYCGDIYNTSYSVYYHAHQKFPKDCCSKCTGKKTAEVTLDKRRNKYWCQLLCHC